MTISLTSELFMLIINVLTLILMALIKTSTKRMLNELKYNKIKIEAIDYALEKVFSDGYAENRNNKMKELLDKEKFQRLQL